MACIYCGAPSSGDNIKGQRVPLCRSLQKMDATRTDVCEYIEELRRTAEDLDTAVMGITSGFTLGGTHMSPPLQFGEKARARYANLGAFLLDEDTMHGGAACECCGNLDWPCSEYNNIGPQGCRVGTARFKAAGETWSRG